eukprot:CAMPEP_0168492302 /NCGR_PEP_ID=MMETSP0228-20121227/70140_1 /TAXON_ID=133427 /ORGANISM="Protoceratium reticulatum, Strain CCCM 535 (=CCMP 1889)" /LENGTH=44 /DNA_ID= /DNA_START= /DNA_END= /DNA_ORIENTATION=
MASWLGLMAVDHALAPGSLKGSKSTLGYLPYACAISAKNVLASS